MARDIALLTVAVSSHYLQDASRSLKPTALSWEILVLYKPGDRPPVPVWVRRVRRARRRHRIRTPRGQGGKGGPGNCESFEGEHATCVNGSCLRNHHPWEPWSLVRGSFTKAQLGDGGGLDACEGGERPLFPRRSNHKENAALPSPGPIKCRTGI